MAMHYSPKAVTDGMIFCLDPANTKSYPGSGGIISDIAGGYTGTITGASFVDLNGGALDFQNSTSHYVLTDFSYSGDWTICFWGYFDSSSGPVNYPIRVATAASTPNTYEAGIFVFYSGNWGFYDGGSSLNGVGTINYAEWYNICVSKSSTTYKTFLNGSNTSSGTLDDIDINTLKLGTRDFGFPIDGKLSHVCVYNRALTEAETTQNYNALKGRFGL